ncbi:WD40 repeat domain-containing protein [Actinomadura xylanilytica]|uniref:WD40 repeat domain-containing protein n=1 Tax=Actinomadura xylanilytica TaxID=887459 RepID=UPI0032E3C8A4
MKQMERPGITILSGTSGVGKSSLLYAGVLSEFRENGIPEHPQTAQWPCLITTPGAAPFEELAAGLSQIIGGSSGAFAEELHGSPPRLAQAARQAATAHRNGGPPITVTDRRQRQRLLLIIDQFEQLFTLCPDEDERRRFVSALHAAATHPVGRDRTPAAMVVIAMRSDFEARCVEYEELAAAVQDRYLLPAMTARQLEIAITEPARAVGARVEGRLVDRLVAAASVPGRVPDGTAGEPGTRAGMLPLLSYALDQAWRTRDRSAADEGLTLRDYEAAGGIEDAVATSAERAYARLGPAQQELSRRVFLRLTAIGDDGVPTADRVSRSELARSGVDADDLGVVLEVFARERLITLGADSVAISHEVLLTAWPAKTALTASAFNPRTGALATSDEDGVVRLWDPGTYRLLKESGKGAGFGRLTFTADGTSIIAVARRSDDSDERRGSVPTTVRFLSSDTLRPTRPPPGFARTPGSPSVAAIAARTGSLATVQDGHVVVDLRGISGGAGNRITVPTGELVSRLAFHPDGRVLATIGGGRLRLWDLATRRQIGTDIVEKSNGGITSVAFSPDGRSLLTWTGLTDELTVRDAGHLPDVHADLCDQVGASFTRRWWSEHVPAGPGYRAAC